MQTRRLYSSAQFCKTHMNYNQKLQPKVQLAHKMKVVKNGTIYDHIRYLSKNPKPKRRKRWELQMWTQTFTNSEDLTRYVIERKRPHTWGVSIHNVDTNSPKIQQTPKLIKPTSVDIQTWTRTDCLGATLPHLKVKGTVRPKKKNFINRSTVMKICTHM